MLLRRDVDYIVRGGTVELVDELTGRVAENRQWPDGLQAAVEAKEGLSLGADGRILGSITIQHFLRLYPRLAGMTATARSSAEELREIYGLEVVSIPPHRACQRIDDPDLIYARREARDAGAPRRDPRRQPEPGDPFSSAPRAWPTPSAWRRSCGATESRTRCSTRRMTSARRRSWPRPARSAR